MREPRNMAASVQARLLRLAKERNQPFDLLLTRYVLERLLYRLGTTKHRDRFVLKGALLLTAWFEHPLRPTRDLDLLSLEESDARALLGIFRDICAVEAADGVVFDVNNLEAGRIREAQDFAGLRLKAMARIGAARIRVVVDVGFGDAIEPPPAEVELPVLLGLPPPRLRAYARETVIAEKFEAMVRLGRANSRMKDFFDIWILSRSYPFTGDTLARAIAATFGRRNMEIPIQPPDALTSAFALDPVKIQQWRSFIANVEVQPGSLDDVITELSKFLMLHAAAARKIVDAGRRSAERPSP